MITSSRQFVHSIVHNFGWHFALMLTSVYIGLKGFIFQLALNTQLPFFKSLGVTGAEECVPGGPHFSFTYYVTYASLVGSIAGAVGVAVFQRYLSRGYFRTAFWTTCLVKLAASAFDIAIVKRYNLSFGVPDKMAFLLGDAIIFQVAYTLDFMPAVVLTSKVCPKGMEASVYALLASYQNLGSNVSRTLGVALIDRLNIKTTPPCDFTNLPMAIVIAHVMLPLLVFPLVFVLIPNAKMTDDLVEKGDEEGGSQFVRVPSEEDIADFEPQNKEFAELTSAQSEQSGQNPTPATALPVDINPAMNDKDQSLADSVEGESLVSITTGTDQERETPTSPQTFEFPSSMVEEEGDECTFERK
ncbi:unnamed protein product [Agarophyton chilense]